MSGSHMNAWVVTQRTSSPRVTLRELLTCKFATVTTRAKCLTCRQSLEVLSGIAHGFVLELSLSWRPYSSLSSFPGFVHLPSDFNNSWSLVFRAFWLASIRIRQTTGLRFLHPSPLRSLPMAVPTWYNGTSTHSPCRDNVYWYSESVRLSRRGLLAGGALTLIFLAVPESFTLSACPYLPCGWTFSKNLRRQA
jgi:hypothetical protein